MRKVEKRVTELRIGLEASQDGGRSILRELLDEERIRVSRDAEKGFRIEWSVSLAVGPPPLDRVAGHSGSGGRSVRLPTRGIARLQPEWAWAA